MVYFSLLLTIIFGILYIKLDNGKSNNNEVILKMIKVDIKGAVNNPGVKEVLYDTTVDDVIKMSGGLLEDADTSRINLSKKVQDEDVIIVYKKDELEKENYIEIVEKECICPIITNDACLNPSFKNIENTSSKISLNTSSKEELMRLNSIGLAKANAIIEYREEHLFNRIEDIMNVKGIGKALFEKIKDYISV